MSINLRTRYSESGEVNEFENLLGNIKAETSGGPCSLYISIVKSDTIGGWKRRKDGRDSNNRANRSCTLLTHAERNA